MLNNGAYEKFSQFKLIFTYEVLVYFISILFIFVFFEYMLRSLSKLACSSISQHRIVQYRPNMVAWTEEYCTPLSTICPSHNFLSKIFTSLSSAKPSTLFSNSVYLLLLSVVQTSADYRSWFPTSLFYLAVCDGRTLTSSHINNLIEDTMPSMGIVVSRSKKDCCGSSAEAEYRAITLGVSELIQINWLLNDLSIPI